MFSNYFTYHFPFSKISIRTFELFLRFLTVFFKKKKRNEMVLVDSSFIPQFFCQESPNNSIYSLLNFTVNLI
jgi:hypothetical protein